MTIRAAIIGGNTIFKSGVRHLLENNGEVEITPVIIEDDQHDSLLEKDSHFEMYIVYAEQKIGCLSALIQKTDSKIIIVTEEAFKNEYEFDFDNSITIDGINSSTERSEEFVQTALDTAVSIGAEKSPKISANNGNLYGLSRRELEILDLIRQSYTNKEIGRILGLSYRTVETHRQNIRAKTKVTTKRELIEISQTILNPNLALNN